MRKGTFILIAFAACVLAACGIYKFNDTSIAPDVHTISVYNIENRAMKVNPALSNTLTMALQDQYRKLTKLEMLEEGGDLEVSGFITSYEVTPTAVTSQEVAAQNRLTVTVKITFKNNKHEEEDFSIPRATDNLIRKALKKYSNKKDAAEALEISERTLYRKIKELGLED